MSITPETLQVLDAYRAATIRLQDEQTRALVRTWAGAWSSIADELAETLERLAADGLTVSGLRRSRKLASALDTIGDQLAELTRGAGVTIAGGLPTALELAGGANAALIASQLPTAVGGALVVGWDRVDRRAVAAIIARTTQQVHASSLPLAPEAVASMRRNLIRSLVAGDNPRTTAARMYRETEGAFNGGLTRALTIARTETLDAMREASRLSDAANADVLTQEWTWVATLSTRTCPACWDMHGRDFPQSQPGPEGHQNCRCTRVPKTKSWAELGFEGIEEPPSLLPDAGATFAALTPEEQLAILGRRRFEAWQAGAYPMGSWATLRQTPEWRPSWVISPAPVAA